MMTTYKFATTESSSESDAGSVVKSNHPDEEVVMLVCRNPKRRAVKKKSNETRHPVYRGIRKRNGDKWVSEIRQPNKNSRIWLGTFPSAEMAARAHDVAVIALKGKSACLNFADSVWRLPVPTTVNVKDIKKAAAEAAEIFRPSEYEPSSSEYVEASDENLMEESVGELPENMSYIDEEAVFGMPGLLVNMAEGLMIPPPPPPPLEWVGDEEMCLWSY